MKGAISKEHVKKVIRALLVSAPHGLTVNELCSEYTAVEFRPIPYRELGYNSAVDLVKDMPDVIRPVFYGTTMILRVVADESTAHIKELVRHQRSTGRNSRIVNPDAVKRPVDITIPAFLQKRLSNILLDFPNGLLVSSLCNNYMKRYGVNLEPKRLGLKTVAQVLIACPDILHLKSDKMGEVYAYPAKGFRNQRGLLETPFHVSNIPITIQDEIVNVLSKHPNGVWAVRFQNEYRAVYKRELNFQRLGFGSIVELMADISDRIEIQRPNSVGDWLLKAKIDVQIAKDAIVDSHTKYALQSPGDLDELIEIYLSYIINPTSFWFQCVSKLEDLSNLMDALSIFYSDKANDATYQFSEVFLRDGQLCCALYEEDGLWYRAIVTDAQDKNNIEVFYIDYGNEGSVSISDLRLLKKAFLQLHAQALPAKLSGIQPKDKEWSQDGNSRFYELTSDRHLFGVMKSFDVVPSDKKLYEKKTIVTSMELTNTNHDVDLHVNQILVDEGFAVSPVYTLSKDPVDTLYGFYKEYFDTLQQVHKMAVENQKNNTKREAKISSTPKNDIVASTTLQLENELSSIVIEDVTTRTVQYPVKRIKLEEGLEIHMLLYDNDAVMTTAEISQLFWTGDILKQMLRRKNAKMPCIILLKEEHPDVFNALLKYKIRGLCTNQGDVKPGLSLYSFESVMDICDIFKLRCEKNENILKQEYEKFKSGSAACYFKEQVPVENLDEVYRLQLQALSQRRKRIYLSLMCNRAQSNAMDEIKEIDEQMKNLEIKMKQLTST